MAAKKKTRDQEPEDIASRNYAAGVSRLYRHPMFSPLLTHAHVIREPYRSQRNLCPQEGWAVVFSDGTVHVHPTRRAEPEEWTYVLAHCLLHLAFGHFQERPKIREWNAACDCFVTQFLSGLRLGRAPGAPVGKLELPTRSEERLYHLFCEEGVPSHLSDLGTAGTGAVDLRPAGAVRRYTGCHEVDWSKCFGEGLSAAVASAVNVAAGVEARLGAGQNLLTPSRRARDWFMSSFPLLGALAANFEIIEDPTVCNRMSISVAAVDAESREIFMNPAAGLDETECRFVMAHELLHVGLRHSQRRLGREPFLWNVACDYVINGWLIEMGVGETPAFGLLYDPGIKGLSAESIYDRIVTDLRRARKLCTLRGIGIGDILERNGPGWWETQEGLSLDDFYRRCLGQGLEYHECGGRGFVPAGLVEEIRALGQPPIPWDVELARWFDNYFPPMEKVRSYARQSRRQSSTPDIPRPRYVPDWRSEERRTFGVILDTSGSMDRTLLAKSLGAIASYSMARDVPRVRVVFCDAVAYDQGYMAPEDIARKVKVRGRGGTILQPGIDLVERAEDFPKDGPILIITDGFCDHFHVRRDHAILMPQGHSLPFVPRGPVFRIK